MKKQCEVCIANTYGLWGMKKVSKKLPKIAQKLLKKLLKGEALRILKCQ